MRPMLVIIPFNLPWDHTADYTHQTSEILSRNHTVVCYMCKEAKSVKECVIHKDKRMFLNTYKKQYLYFPLYILPFRRFRFIDRINIVINVCILRALMWWKFRREAFVKKIIWTFDPEQTFLIKQFGSSYETVYDCVDYHGGQLEKALIATCAHFFVNSHVLYRLHRKQRRDAILVPQGFRLSDFLSFSIKRRKNSKPIIGYVGGINNRLDYALLHNLVQRTPEYEYMFIGPIQTQGDKHFETTIQPQIDTLFSYANVHHVANVPKKDIPSIIERFDVAIIPYRADALYNRYSYPTKVFEYFYMGKPVVATPIDELKRYPRYVRIGATADEWMRQISNLFMSSWSDSYIHEQRRLASANSWEEKIHTIIRNIKKD